MEEQELKKRAAGDGRNSARRRVRVSVANAAPPRKKSARGGRPEPRHRRAPRDRWTVLSRRRSTATHLRVRVLVLKLLLGGFLLCDLIGGNEKLAAIERLGLRIAELRVIRIVGRRDMFVSKRANMRRERQQRQKERR